jgi:hypothetical protein
MRYVSHAIFQLDGLVIPEISFRSPYSASPDIPGDPLFQETADFYQLAAASADIV